MGFEIYVDSLSNTSLFTASNGELISDLPEPLYINRNWGCALTFLAFCPKDIMNLPNMYSASFRGKVARWPPAQVDEEQVLLQSIISALPRGINFSTSKSNGELITTLKGGGAAGNRLGLSADLAEVLGYPTGPTRTEITSGQRSSGINLMALNPWLSVKCGFIKKSIVAGSYMHVLKSVPLQLLRNESKYCQYFCVQNLIPLEQGELVAMRFQFVTKHGEPIRFKRNAQLAMSIVFKEF